MCVKEFGVGLLHEKTFSDLGSGFWVVGNEPVVAYEFGGAWGE